MDRQFELKLDDIRSLLLTMGGEVEKSLELAMQGLLSGQVQVLSQVFELEKKINDLHLQVDRSCVNYIAKQGPVASDLRLVLSMLKIISDLERMGDYCVTIAYSSRDIINRRGFNPPQDIKEMSNKARKMVKDSLDSFVRRDEALGHQVINADNEVDKLRDQLIVLMKNEIKRNPQNIDSAIDMIFIAKNLERIGDHSTNIAEDVIYASSGKDIRHGHF